MTDEPTPRDVALKVRQLLGQATLARTRGQQGRGAAGASPLLRQALQLTQEALRLDDQSWEAYELQGDVLMDLGRAQEGLASYRRARELHPDRMALEDKLARAALRTAARGHMLAQADLILAGKGRGGEGKRRSAYAALFSLMPGLGQLYNGQLLKGAVIGVLMIACVALASQQLDVSSFRTSMLGGVSPVWVVVIALLWVYAVVDAIVYASRSGEPGGPGPP